MAGAVQAGQQAVRPDEPTAGKLDGSQEDSQSARPIAIFGLLQLRSCVMGIAWTPPIVPRGDDENVYLVVDNLGSYGEVWREIETVRTDLECVITDLLDGQYNSPVRVVGFNTAEGWSRDVSAEVAVELCRRFYLQSRELPESILEFVQRHEPRADRSQLRLV
jgi:hypothetical protein